MIMRRAIAAGGENRIEGLILRIAANDPTPPLRREIERIEKRAEDGRIADAQNELIRSDRGDGLERQAENFGIRGLAIGAAEIFEAGLQEFARPVVAEAEDRPAIRIGGGPPAAARGEIMPADRDRIFRPQAIVRAGLIAREIKPAADIFARIEEDRGISAGSAARTKR